MGGTLSTAHEWYIFKCPLTDWIVGVDTFHGNPYNGYTLSATPDRVEESTGWKEKGTYIDLGCRGHD